MPLPTLAIKGRLRSLTENAEEQEELDKQIPYEFILEWIRRRQSLPGVRNRVIVIKAETASGKSTLMIAELYLAFVANTVGPGIICTQPRTLTAVRNVPTITSVPVYADKFEIGVNIGWSTRFNKLPPRKTGVLSATIGTLRQQLMMMPDEQICQMYKIIIIDEVHERDIDTDITLFLLKQLLIRNAENIACPFVLLSSATLNTKLFTNYFEVDFPVDPRNILNTNVAWCAGRTFHIDKKWEWNENRTVNNYLQSSVDVVTRILETETEYIPNKSDILIFLPGALQIENVDKLLQKLSQKRVAEKKSYFAIITISSEDVRAESNKYRLLDTPLELLATEDYPPLRRVILSTNIAETGLTIDSLRYVIDGGFNKESVYYAQHNTNCLFASPASQSRITQRMGRAGRLFDGEFYPLYPFHIFEKLQKQQFSQIMTSDITTSWLTILYEQVKSRTDGCELRLQDIDLIEMPPVESIRQAMQKLYTLGFIAFNVRTVNFLFNDMLKAEVEEFAGPEVFSITKLGVLAAQMMLITPENIRMILAGFSWGFSIMDLISIAAYTVYASKLPGRKKPLDWSAVYATAFSKKDVYAALRVYVSCGFFDGIVLITAVNEIMGNKSLVDSMKDLMEWCVKVSINYPELMTLLRERDDIIDQLYNREFAVEAYYGLSLRFIDFRGIGNYVTKLKQCIADGYRLNLLTFDKKRNCYKTAKGIEVKVPQFADVVANNTPAQEAALTAGIPQKLLYHSLEIKNSMKTNENKVVAGLVTMINGFIRYDSEWLIN